MNYRQRNTATFLFKHALLTAFVLFQIGCFDSLSSTSGVCASDDDCLGAQTCNDGRCAVSCFDTSDCPASETCAFNRCEPAPLVYEDASNATSAPGPINNLDGGLTPPSDSSLDAALSNVDQALVDVSVIEDMQTSSIDAAPIDAMPIDAAPVDAAAALDVSPSTDADLPIDEQDMVPADAT
jgi:hypothetical protein